MEIDVAQWRDVFVQVRALESLSRLHPADVGIEGRYKVPVPADLEDGVAGAVALDAFHSAVPVSELESFDIAVLTEAGTAIECSDADTSGFRAGEVRKQPTLRKVAWCDPDPPVGLVLTLTPEHARVVNAALVEFLC
ncbi:hypothetical protein V6O07_05460, partial [Arthrospira platensis SPKY2]